MSDKLRKKIGEEMRRIAHTDDKSRFTLMSGTVDTVDEDEGTAVVKLTVHGGDVTEGIGINVRLNNTLGFLAIPSSGASCIVGEVDGPGQLELLRASEYSKIVFNGGSNGGLINISDLVERLNNVEYDLNALKNIFSTGWSVVPNDGGAALKLAAASWAGDLLTATIENDIEDPNVKH